ncbi:MAG: hypothetical protein H0W84_00865 [Bacteroidetes bacterium]|nr:hypothetical protein [Bacteroidota bacterium]
MSLMNDHDGLFTLIKSMTMSEKRYFKISASKHIIGEQNKYIRLFEALEKQKNYDEELLRKKFRDKNFMKQLPVTKNYLSNFILKAMRIYNSQASINSELKGMLTDAEYLYGKGLYHHCSKILRKAKKFASKYEQYIELLEILDIERRLNIQRGSDALNMETKSIQLFKEKDAILAKLKNLDKYQAIDDYLISYMRKGPTRTKKDETRYRELLSNILLKNEELAITSRSKRVFYNVQAHAHLSNGDLSAGYIYRKKMLDFIELHPEQTEINPGVYILALGNIILTCCDQKKFKEAMLYIDKLRKYNVNSVEHKVKVFQITYLHELHILLTTAQYEKAINLMPEVEKGLKMYFGKINKQYEIIFYFNIATIYNVVGRYNDALAWNNKLLNDREVAIRYDVLCQARILNIIIHFELGNYDQLEYLAISAQRFLQKKNYLHQVEAAFLNFISLKLPRIMHNKKMLIRALAELKDDILVVKKKKIEASRFEYFDFISWLESKIENRSFAEIVAKKSSRKN